MTVPPLIDCSQASNSAASRPTSLASMVLSGATATCGSRGLADSLMPALPGSARSGPDYSTRCLDSSPQWNGQSTCQWPQLFTIVPEAPLLSVSQESHQPSLSAFSACRIPLRPSTAPNKKPYRAAVKPRRIKLRTQLPRTAK